MPSFGEEPNMQMVELLHLDEQVNDAGRLEGEVNQEYRFIFSEKEAKRLIAHLQKVFDIPTGEQKPPPHPPAG